MINKRNIQLIRSCLIIVLTAILIVGMASCASGSVSTSMSALTTTSTPNTTLTSITVTPNPSNNLVIGSVEQFKATGNYSDGSSSDITSQVIWDATKTDANVADISSGGLAIGLAAGSSEITASENGTISSAVMLMVVAASQPPIVSYTTTTSTIASSLSTIIVMPASPSNILIGGTQQFTASGNYSNGTTKDITSQVTWASDNDAVITISSKGLATGLALGSADITATLGRVSNIGVPLTVTSTATTTTISTSPYIVLSPASGPPGYQFTIVGYNFTPGATISASNVTLNGAPCLGFPYHVDGTGGFTITVNLTTPIGANAIGTWIVSVTDSSGKQASRTFGE